MYPKPKAVHVTEKWHRLVSSHLFFSYFYIRVLLPTEFLRIPSARCGTPMEVPVQGLTYRCEGEYLGAGGNPISTA